MNPLRLLDAAFAFFARRAHGLSEAELDDLVTPDAIERMWAEAFDGQTPDSRP